MALFKKKIKKLALECPLEYHFSMWRKRKHIRQISDEIRWKKQERNIDEKTEKDKHEKLVRENMQKKILNRNDILYYDIDIFIKIFNGSSGRTQL